MDDSSTASVADEVEADLARQLVHCRGLRQAVLRWAFEGRLVDQEPDDEPATVLIERIEQTQRESSAMGARRRKR